MKRTFHQRATLTIPIVPNQCLRQISTIPPPPPPPPKGFSCLTTRGLISLRGQDAPYFLQGLITRNVSPLNSKTFPNRRGVYSAFLNASGRILHDVFIYPDRRHNPNSDPAFLIDVDAEEVLALVRHLKRYKLRAKFTLRVVDRNEAQIWSAWGGYSGPQCIDEHLWAMCDDGRAEGMGTRFVVPNAKAPNSSKGELKGVTAYDLRRMMKGVAEGQAELPKESALPLESNMDYMEGIDFRKGCYVGQELTIRTHHTGVVRKRILPVQLYDSGTIPEALEYNENTQVAMPPRNTHIRRLDDSGRSTGKFLGGIGNIGLALCRLKNMTDIVFTGEGNQWNPQDEFMLTWPTEEGREGGKVKVKAFVPEWHRNGVSARDTHREGNTTT